MMSQGKEEKIVRSQNWGPLDTNVAGVVTSFLSQKEELLSAMYASKASYKLFSPNLNRHFALRARICVILGDVDGLKRIAKAKPEVLFDKGEVSDLRQRIFYQVSAYQLILFLCDLDMKQKIMRLIPASLHANRQAQDLEMQLGGYDLIKLGSDPLVVAEKGFKELTEFKRTFRLFDGEHYPVIFPLLQNPDGIIYYQDNKKIEHFYYVNQETQEIRKLHFFIGQEDKQKFELFKASFASMEINSGRRSSNEEYEWFAKKLSCTLVRQGIQYQQNGILYRDTCSSFRLINAYRTCIKMNKEKKDNNNSTSVFWREDVGKAQGEEMWLLQRLCEKNQPFYPSITSNGFMRSLVFHNPHKEKEESIVIDGKLASGLGSKFALYKGPSFMAQPIYCCTGLAGHWRLVDDLLALSTFVKEAKENILKAGLTAAATLKHS